MGRGSFIRSRNAQIGVPTDESGSADRLARSAAGADASPLRAGYVVRHSFEPLLARAEVPRIRFHDLRHSTATLLLTLGVHPKIVQELLGHSEIFVTLDVYSHILPTLQEEAMHRLNGLLAPSTTKGPV